MIPVSAPPRVRALLRTTPDGPVPLLHRGRDAVYVEVRGVCVGVVSRRATAVPCALRSDLAALPEVGSARLLGGVLHLDADPLLVGRVVDVSVPTIRTRAGLPAPAPGDIASMVGRGEGLTPYDDDVLCGWIAAHRAAGVPTGEVDAAVRACLGRTTLLSATLLECAMHGEVILPFARWLSSLGTADEVNATAALAEVGHTSGAGMLQGARAALVHLDPIIGVVPDETARIRSIHEPFRQGLPRRRHQGAA